jgi:segregation and condensation protein A
MLTQQFVDHCGRAGEPTLETSAEFVGAAATLMWLKSKLLLPRSLAGAQDEEEAPFKIRLEMLQQLVDYYSLKKAAGFLSTREEEQQPHHCRGIIPSDHEERPLGLEVGLDELARLFTQSLQRAADSKGTVQNERWQVSAAITALKIRLAAATTLTLHDLFTPAMCRSELIVTFLAVLELMKEGILAIHNDGSCQQVIE